jgi:hypothetical protein
MKKRNPLPYEKKIFSQNLEDGIIELLVSNIINSNKIAIEIGSGNGSENMLRNLVSNHGYTGIGHDLNKNIWHHENYIHNQRLISLDSLEMLLSSWPPTTPDFFSLDIDSFDYWVLKTLIQKLGFRPSVICVEYLCYYGPTRLVSAKTNLKTYALENCGASLGLYKSFLAQQGYKFFTCDTFGINAFFYLEEKLNDVSMYETKDWAFYPKYKKYVDGIIDNINLEFNHDILLG